MTIVSPTGLNQIYGLYCVCSSCVSCNKTHIRYVGLTTVGAQRRFHLHCKSSSTSKYAVARWIVKHGKSNIRYTVLQVCNASTELDSAEIEWIAKLGTYGSGNNIGGLNETPGGRFVPKAVEASIAARKRTRASRIENRVCPICGDIFTVSKKSGAKTCGSTCGRAFAANTTRARAAAKVAQRSCDVCGKKLSVQVSRSKDKTCSEYCFKQLMKKVSNIGSRASYASHVRWHVNRDKSSDECMHCDSTR